MCVKKHISSSRGVGEGGADHSDQAGAGEGGINTDQHTHHTLYRHQRVAVTGLATGTGIIFR